jgi:uncharacterized protein (TIGR03083 family)
VIGPIRVAFDEAAAYFVSTVETIRPEQFATPGLGEWSVRDLVGHTSRSLLTIEIYLEQPVASVQVADAADYYLAVLRARDDPTQHGNMAQVAQRGREAGAALGPDPASALRAIAARVRKLVAETHEDQLMSTAVGGMRLGDYLPTRIFELVVHTLDLAAALGAPLRPPAAPAQISLELAAAVALRSGRGSDVLLALTGRRPLPVGFSVVI